MAFAPKGTPRTRQAAFEVEIVWRRQYEKMGEKSSIDYKLEYQVRLTEWS